MWAQRRRDMRAHTWEHMWEHRGEHTYESTGEDTHTRAQRSTHRRHTYKSTEEHTYEVPRLGSTRAGRLPSRDPHGQVTRAILYGNLQEKCWTQIPGDAFWLEIYREKCTWTSMKSHFVWKFTGKMPDPIFADGILCGNLQGKTHMDMSEEPFCVEIYREYAEHGSEHHDLPPGLNWYRKNPFSAHTVWGTMRW